MTRGWNGYLVRALNELVSLNDACRSSDFVPAKPSISRRHSEQQRKKKSSARRRIGRNIHQWSEIL